MASKDAGKRFEADIKASFPPEFYVERYKDDTSGFYGVSNPADYRLYRYPLTFLLELKSHKGKSLPLANIRPNQIQGMAKAVEHKGIYAGFIINFRDYEKTYYITVQDMIEFINTTDRKSIPMWICEAIGIEIPQTKKRVRYSYDMRSLLWRYYDE